MLGFETLTMAPLDRALIDADKLDREEKAWLNAYHDRVLYVVGPHVPGDVRLWLEQACAAI
jgi:Xaa-Pro aminopeptidase